MAFANVKMLNHILRRTLNYCLHDLCNMRIQTSPDLLV